jgi:hypothetical protein
MECGKLPVIVATVLCVSVVFLKGAWAGSWDTQGGGVLFTRDLVGIGTVAPLTELDITTEGDNDPGICFNNDQGNPADILFFRNSALTSLIRLGSDSNGATFDFQDRGSSRVSRFFIMGNGYVGIGTTNPRSLLAVNGTITAKEVKVTAGGWPDFVFTPGHELPSLEKVEAYIKDNKHLPDIPSAGDISRQGLPMGEMMARQMRKIEELTLYLIDLKKQNEELRQESSALKERITTLERAR